MAAQALIPPDSPTVALSSVDPAFVGPLSQPIQRSEDETPQLDVLTLAETVSVRAVTTTATRRLLTPRERAWIAAYLGPAAQIPTEACRMVGYPAPSAQGRIVFRRLRQAIDVEVFHRNAAKVMLPPELIESLSSDARNGAQIGWANSMKAKELLARIHGLLQDRVSLQLDTGALAAEIKEALGFIKGNVDAIDAELVNSPLLLPDSAR